MPRNGSGSFALPAGNPVTTGTSISSTWSNTTLSDIASALTQSVSKDGQTTMTGNLPMGNNKVTGLADGTLATDAVSLGQLADDSMAGNIGYLPAGTGAVATTVEVKLFEGVSVLDFGASTAGTASANSAAFNLAAASGAKKIIVPQGSYTLDPANPVTPASGQTWSMDGATFTFTGTTGRIFSLVTKNDWALTGKFSITGDGSTVGAAIGIYISDCSRWSIEDPTISNVRGTGIYMDPGASTTGRGTHGTITNPVIYNCYYGYTDEPGTGAEYCTIINPRIYGCTVHGLKTCAGNIVVVGGHIVDNTGKGVHLAAGSNHGHGTFSGTNINHNGSYGIHAEQVTNGFTFDGCHIYENDIWFDRSKGMQILGGHLDVARIYNYKDGSSGINIIDGCYMPGAYGPKRDTGSNDGHDQLIIRNTWGPGSFAASGGKDTAGFAFNDPSMCYAQAQRDAASTQSLTSGVPATLTFNSVNYLFDRRGVIDTGTGLFTIPANLSGLYHVDLDLLFSGTAMNVADSYIEVKINTTTKKLISPSIYSTTTLQAKLSFDIYINAGEALNVVAIITGTTPTFGHATWPSNISLNKIS